MSASRHAMVLVADDDAAARHAIRALLSAEGYVVEEAADGTEALEILSRAADANGALPDVVLLDFVMPVSAASGSSASCVASSARPPQS